MVQTILCFKSISPYKIILWNMTIIAGGPWLVGAFLPGLVIGSHYVTVNASRRVIGKVRSHPGHVKQVEYQTHNDTHQYYGGHDKLPGEDFLHRL
jgi:hypothetical protein